MGFLTSIFGAGQAVQQVQAAFPTNPDPSTLPLTTPYATNELSRIAWLDYFGDDLPINTRAAAMRLPAIARARNLLVSTISRLPLQTLSGAQPVASQPAWQLATGDGSSPQLRTAWTVDDLLFYGWSCWWRERDGDELAAARRISPDDWGINDDLQVEVNGEPTDPRNVIVIPGLHEGILSFGADVLSDTRDLYRMVRARLLNPTPQLDLHQTSGEPLSDEQIDALIARWAQARQGKNGGVAYTSPNLEINELGQGDAQLMIEARNAAAVDCARLVGVTASRVDATSPKASLNYETSTGRNQELVDFDLALYMTPITARLSLDDVSAPGERVAFDLADFISQAPSVTGPSLAD